MVLVTDGPYTETKEHMGGFWILEAADMDEALAWARKGAHLMRCGGRWCASFFSTRLRREQRSGSDTAGLTGLSFPSKSSLERIGLQTCRRHVMFIEVHEPSHFFRKERNADHFALCGDDKEAIAYL